MAGASDFADVGQPARDPGLDVERHDDLLADRGAQRSDDVGFVDHVRHEAREPIGVEGDLVDPHGDGREEDRQTGQHEGDARQDPPPPDGSRVGDFDRCVCLRFHNSPP